MNVLQVAGFVGLADGIGKVLGAKPGPEVAKAAKARGKTTEEVAENLDNKTSLTTTLIQSLRTLQLLTALFQQSKQPKRLTVILMSTLMV